jgi:hypothetical protein
MDKLIGVFVADNVTLMAKMDIARWRLAQCGGRFAATCMRRRARPPAWAPSG